MERYSMKQKRKRERMDNMSHTKKIRKKKERSKECKELNMKYEYMNKNRLTREDASVWHEANVFCSPVPRQRI
jgi:hypothetical protein